VGSSAGGVTTGLLIGGIATWTIAAKKAGLAGFLSFNNQPGAVLGVFNGNLLDC
jgi:hypothetical protein